MFIGNFAASNRFRGSGSSQVQSISFTNPSPTHKVWRSGIERTGTITPITGYTTTWQILNHRTRSVVASGSGTTVTHTFTFASMDDCNTYDLLVRCTNGTRNFYRLFPFEFTCLPQRPVVFDRTISAASYTDDNWTNRPGYRVRVTGSFTGTVEQREFKSDDPTNPQHWVFDNCTITSTDVSSFKPQMFKNVIFDGCTDEDIPYGLTMLKGTNGGLNQQFVFDWNGYGADIDKFSQNVIICGVYGNGNNLQEEGNTAFRILPGGRSAAVNADTRQFTNLVMFNCKAENSWDEGFYLGYFTDSPDGSGYRSTYIADSLFYNLIAENCGREAFQIMAKDSEVAKCRFVNGATRQIVGHRNCVQLSGGSDNLDFYGNWVELSIANNLFVPGAGQTGGNVEVHGNIFYSTVGVGDIGNIWSRADLSTTYPGGISQKFYNNTIVCATGTSVFTLYEAFATDFNDFEAINNIMVCNTTNNYVNGSGMDASHAIFTNYKQTYANIGTIGFTSVGSNFKLSSKTSPAFGSVGIISTTSPFADYDYDGAAYLGWLPANGAYSGYELVSGENFASIGATSQTINGLTYNVQSAELDHSIQKVGSNLYRFEVYEGEARVSDSGVERSELSSGEGNAIAYGTTIWTSYAFKTNEGSSWTGLTNICGQFHAGAGSPNLSMRINEYNQMRFYLRAGLSSSYTQTILYTDNAFVPGQWYNVVIRSVFSQGTPTGSVTIWVNGVQVADVSSYITGYSDASSTYFKFGIYRSTSAPDNEVVYFANVETGTTDLTNRITNPLLV